MTIIELAPAARNRLLWAVTATAVVLPFCNADAQSRAIPASAAPAATKTSTGTVSSTASRADPLDEAQSYSRGYARVGVYVSVSEAAKQRGYTGEILGREIVDSLKVRGVPGMHFFSDAPPGAPTLAAVFINTRPYTTADGTHVFGPVSIRKEFDAIKTKFIFAAAEDRVRALNDMADRLSDATSQVNERIRKRNERIAEICKQEQDARDDLNYYVRNGRFRRDANGKLNPGTERLLAEARRRGVDPKDDIALGRLLASYQTGPDPNDPCNGR